MDGKEYQIAAWVKERKDGSGKFFSIMFEPKDAQQAAEGSQEPVTSGDVPF